MNLTYTVSDVIKASLSKIGVDYDNTEPANIELAHKALNMMIGTMSADVDLHINRIVPLTGFSTLSETIDAPPEYINMLTLNLCLYIADDFDQKISKVLADLASMSISIIKYNNIMSNTGKIPANS